jgi:ApaG protein
MPKSQIAVHVRPEYLMEQSDPDACLYSFAYTIEIANSGDTSAQLISRHWIITDALGHVEEVKGLGVVGQQPLLQPGQAFEYTSGCRLRTATGTMRGSFHFVTEEGTPFEVPVERFYLDASDSDTPHVLH